MTRALATVELTEDEDGAVSARVDAHGRPLDTRARRAVLHAVATALELDEDDPDAGSRETVWTDEIAKRRAALAEGRAGTIPASELIARLEATARGRARR